MFKAVIVVVVALSLLGAVRQGLGWWRRERIIRQVETTEILRSSRSVSVRALVSGVASWRGLDARRRSRLIGDLVLTADRFLLVTDRGVLGDYSADSDRGLRSARCTGPGRLVLEGGTGRDDGMFRLEIAIDDAQGWAADLVTFVRAVDGERFTSFRTNEAS